jgi:hypothetical protein
MNARSPQWLVSLMMALLLAHELDAVSQSEWRLLYVLRGLSDTQGRDWFVALHVPVFWALWMLIYHAQTKIQHASRIGLALFCIVHCGLHLRLHSDPLSTFTSPLSWSLIVGCALAGTAYLAQLFFRRQVPAE